MWQGIINAFKEPELRKKILFTLAIIALYRVGSYIPVPGIPFGALTESFNDSNNGVMMLMNLFSGNALSYFSVFSLGIMPYITASIVMQLMRYVFPQVAKWYEEGEQGYRRITQITRYLTLGLAFFNAVGYLLLFQSPTYGIEFSSEGLPGVWFVYVCVVIALIAGTAFIMWMGELITQRGIGNGMSLIIFANVVSGFPPAIYSSLVASNDGILQTVLIIAVVIAVIPLIVHIERAQRRIPVKYSSARAMGMSSVARTTYIPIKVSSAGVIPIIFASALLYLPIQLSMFFPDAQWFQAFANALSRGPVNWIVTVILIIAFSYFYSMTTFNPESTAKQLQRSGGFIQGIRPGKPTEEYLKKVLMRIALPGGLFIAAIAVVPTILFQFTSNQLIQAFGGTSILIMVGVALDTMTKLESQLKMHNYDGFFK